jgi:hypothetical protein
MTRSEIEEGAAWARRLFRKPEPMAPERKLTQAERIAAWSARNREDEGKANQTRAAAADGSRWQRVA